MFINIIYFYKYLIKLLILLMFALPDNSWAEMAVNWYTVNKSLINCMYDFLIKKMLFVQNSFSAKIERFLNLSIKY